MSKPAHILIVDDQEEVRQLIERMIGSLGHSASFAENGLSALAQIRKNPPDLVLMDVEMPEMNGPETLEQLKADPNTRDIPIIMVSGLGLDETVLQCLELGADDFLRKPCDFRVLQARVKSGLQKKRIHDQEVIYRKHIEEYNLRLEERVREEVARNAESHMATIFALSKLAESRDPETGDHLERMRQYGKVLCVELGKQSKYATLIDQDYVNNVYAASPLHDIGKVGIPDHVLLKPGKLTDEEFEIIKTHTTIGAETLQAVHDQYGQNEFVRLGIEIAESHHEKWDGSGYPKGLGGEDIPFSARILALGDVYDALTSTRCYKEAFSHEKSRSIIIDGRGKHFDSEVVDAFIAAEEKFVQIRQRYAAA